MAAPPPPPHPPDPQHPGRPRLAPLTAAGASPEQRQLLDTVGGDQALNIFATLAHHPGLFRKWLPFGGKLLSGGKLDARDRELVILRTALLCHGAYEWGQHVGIGQDAGLSPDEIERIADGPDSPGWTPADAALLRAVDELVADHVISPATWSALAERYDAKQLIELTMLSGHYAMLAGVLNSLGVQPERPLPALGRATIDTAEPDTAEPDTAGAGTA